MTEHASPLRTTGRCPICGTQIEDKSTNCEHCGILYHADCWEYSGKCAVYGCGATAPTEQPKPLPRTDSGGLWVLGTRAWILAGLIPFSLITGNVAILLLQSPVTALGAGLLALSLLPALWRALKRRIPTPRQTTEMFYRGIGLLLLVVLVPGFDRLDFPLLNWMLLLFYAGVVAKALHVVPQANFPAGLLLEILVVTMLIFSQLDTDALSGPGIRSPVRTTVVSVSLASRLKKPLLVENAQSCDSLRPEVQHGLVTDLTAEDCRTLPRVYNLVVVPLCWDSVTFEQIRQVGGRIQIRVRLPTIWQRMCETLTQAILKDDRPQLQSRPRAILLPPTGIPVELRYTAPGSSILGDDLAVLLNGCTYPKGAGSYPSQTLPALDGSVIE
jgi:hypothetical protein